MWFDRGLRKINFHNLLGALFFITSLKICSNRFPLPPTSKQKTNTQQQQKNPSQSKLEKTSVKERYSNSSSAGHRTPLRQAAAPRTAHPGEAGRGGGVPGGQPLPCKRAGGAGGESRETPAGPYTLPALGWMELQYPATRPYLSLLSASHTPPRPDA